MATKPLTLADLRTKHGNHLLAMLDCAGDTAIDSVALESLCLEAAHEIRRLNGEIEKLTTRKETP